MGTSTSTEIDSNQQKDVKQTVSGSSYTQYNTRSDRKREKEREREGEKRQQHKYTNYKVVVNTHPINSS